ncbi:hypothetical protein I79_025574 [Cricetulus griseus]|uniref:Uncharacterized protein n=1 Tax=Cricetulus griseus TaxID=10029 RepID=G3INP3_CRIGR|nr:hypothetical protein I79_025574 [Cricetulus griseus]
MAALRVGALSAGISKRFVKRAATCSPVIQAVEKPHPSLGMRLRQGLQKAAAGAGNGLDMEGLLSVNPFHVEPEDQPQPFPRRRLPNVKLP